MEISNFLMKCSSASNHTKIVKAEVFTTSIMISGHTDALKAKKQLPYTTVTTITSRRWALKEILPSAVFVAAASVLYHPFTAFVYLLSPPHKKISKFQAVLFHALGGKHRKKVLRAIKIITRLPTHLFCGMVGKYTNALRMTWVMIKYKKVTLSSQKWRFSFTFSWGSFSCLWRAVGTKACQWA